MEKKFELYTWSTCPFCANAKSLLNKKAYEYVEYVIDNDDNMRQELIKSSGQTTVPYIFLNGNLIGGFDDLRLMDEKGQL